MSNKWTKEQIETAKKYLEKGSCYGVGCKRCPIREGQECMIGLSTINDKQEFAIIIAQHEHDADQPEAQPNPPNYPKMERVNIPTDMSVHDYWRYQFAGMAMQGLLADSKYNANAYETAEDSIKFADELLKQQEENK